MARLASALMLAASLLPLLVSAEPLVLAELNVGALVLAGELRHETDELSVAMVPPAPGPWQWSLRADRLVVNWTNASYLEQGQPPDWSRPQNRYEVAAGSDQQVFHLAKANASASNTSSDLLLQAAGRTSLVFAEVSTLQAVAAEAGIWSAGSGPARAAATSAESTSFAATIEAGLVQIAAPRGSIRMAGNFSVYLWGADVVVHEGARSSVFWSGSRPETEPGLPVRIVSEQFLRLDVIDGQLNLNAERLVQWAEREATFTGSFTAKEPRTANRSSPSASERPSIHVGDDMALRLSNVTTRLRGFLERSQEETASNNPVRTNPPQPAAVAPKGGLDGGTSDTRLGPWAWLATGFLLAAMALTQLYLRPFRRPRIADVEWAILAGQPRRALFWARRLIARDPTDPDVLFLYGSALMHNSRPNTVVREVEPLAKELSRPARRGIAYLLAIASASIGDRDRAERWGKEAAADAALARKLVQQNIWTPAKDAPDTSAYA